ncbi:MAG: hypothetical protein QNJ65_10045 [Xenococcaceae cyanobacterium MO_234.B1]|nr:hypothetical protein [Xenococcaceae cyanobacterium MO_234.B1]
MVSQAFKSPVPPRDVGVFSRKRDKKRKAEDRKPVIVIRGESKVYANAVEIPYPCRIVYQPDNPLGCGARVWIEVLGFDLAAMQPPANVAHNV